MIKPGIRKAAETTSTPTVLGSRWRFMMRGLLAPMERAASMNSFCFKREHLAAHQARRAHPADDRKGDK